MQTVFGLLFLTSLIALPFGLVKPSLFSKIGVQTRKGVAGVLGGLLLASFVLTGVTAKPIPASIPVQTISATVEKPAVVAPAKSETSPAVVEKPIEKQIEAPTQTASAPAQQTQPEVKYYQNTAGSKVQSPTNYDSPPTNATARCRDGKYSFSQNHRGTCSGHGGVVEWL